MEANGRILVPLDGSGCGESIIPRVEELAVEKNEGICLLRVVSAHTFPGVDPTEAQSESCPRGGKEYLQGLEDHLRAKGFDVDTHVRYGDDAGGDTGLRSPERYRIDSNVDPGKQRNQGFFFKSVAEKVLRDTPKPIFLVRCN